MRLILLLALAFLLSGCCNIIADFFDRPGFSTYSGFEDFSMSLRLAANGDAALGAQNVVTTDMVVQDINVFSMDGSILCGQPGPFPLGPAEGINLELRDCGSWIKDTRVEVKIEISYDKLEGSKLVHYLEEGTAKVTVTEDKIWSD